ncbi:autotransporter outer membrane beta-barrel domain-containing protein [Hyphomicrobium sp. LHD-15]|uniref:autotransporter outer membrane beta-barrel domain-containing protein n=1 Tax=Hyphomicrobium sp. LHD-15 TaxID=3072142 RepID=UPI00280E87DD|nr:autotransporter outer membrane beta-barrel domain-containing protein [Hyphomicrobium sp. LHD-15]MDQ8697668.1 autotransporter outer membrane beta-barrel domain-containing protein [Hyphomicrobium sp. LHD-15]
MPQIVQFHPLKRVVQLKRVMWAAVALGALELSSTGSAFADGSAGCDAANRGSLNIRASAGASALRGAALERGETLALNVTTHGRAAIAVSDDDGATRTLHSGRSTTVLFVAPRTASYDLRLEADATAEASLGVKCTSVARADAESALLARRKAFVSERDPDRVRIDRPSTGFKPFGDTGQTASADGEAPRDITASVSVSELTAAMNPGDKKDPGILDFWFEGRHLNYDTSDVNARETTGNATIMYFGSKYMLGPDIMLGALAQFDQAGEGAGVSASGWMAGPYMSVRFGPGIIFDGRAAWGVANKLPNGIAVDTVSADRSLLRGTLRGSREVGGWTVAPSVGLSYVEDTPAAYSAYTEATQSPGSGRLDVLPEFKRRFDLDSSTYVEPRIAAGGFVAFDDISQLGPHGVGQVPDLQWKAEAGVAVGVKDGVNMQATGGVETGAQSAADNWAGRLQLNMPLGK